MKQFFMDESGQGMIEYGLIIALVAVAAIVALKAFKEPLNSIFNKASTELSSAAGTAG